MTRRSGIGKTGLTIAIIASLAMIAIPFIFAPAPRISGELGICLPSPNMWQIHEVPSLIINTVLIAAVAAGIHLLNRAYNFVRSTRPVATALFPVMVASNPWLTGYLCSSTILCVVNLISTAVLFGVYKSRNATQQIFLIATLLSVGSMFQHAFIPMVVPFVVAAIVMKAFRIKEFLALIMGLIAPYWVAVGLGLVRIENFTLPQISNLFDDIARASDIFVLMLSVGTAMFIGFILGLNNSIKLYAGNSQVNAMNMTFSLIGLTCMICIFIDFTNMMAYLTTLYLTVALQMANLCALWSFRREWIVVALPMLAYIGFFIAMMAA